MNVFRQLSSWDLINWTCIVFIISLTACGDDDDDDNNDNGPTDLKEVSTLVIADIANNNDGADVQVYITQNLGGEDVDSYRVMMVKEANSSGFDLDAANNVAEGNYSVIDPEDFDLTLQSTSRDIDGEAISEGEPYRAFVLSIRDGSKENILSPPSNTLTLARESAVRNLTEYFPAGSGGMDTDANGNILMGDFGPSLGGTAGTKVYRITPQGDVSVFAEGLVGASGNEFDSKGNFYQSNISGATVSKIDANGNVSTFVNTTLQGPVGITFDKDDNMYVVNCGKNDISRITPSGNAEVFVSHSLFNCPNGITIDDDGNLFVANFGNGDILRVTPDKKVTRTATIPGSNNGHLLFHDGLLWVVDRGGHAIYTVTTTGVTTKFAGTGLRGNRNGALQKATFSLPNDVTFSPDGRFLYVNDVDPKAAANVISPVIIRVIEIVE